MPHLLTLVATINDISRFEQIALGSNFTLKSGVEFEHIVQWLSLLPCDLLCIPYGLEIGKQEQLAALLWRKNIAARFVVYNFEQSTDKQSAKSKLFGAELALGAPAEEIIKKVAHDIAVVHNRANDPFGILVIDDLHAARDIICSYIESLGFSDVRGVTSAREAFEVIAQDKKRVSCIVTDIRMPEVSGTQFITQLRSDSSVAHIPVIVLTANGDADTLINCLKAGASGFLVKPPKRNDMIRELARARRTLLYHQDPRLATPEEIDAIRDSLEALMN